ncbi:hypothetical protein SAMD00019534_086520, partial [Acytostelium subglobosum LB1]|uniref:hypothetical protein n=1 Tax=Acytostelium subglobosum LB1 TaxID=1410327 RepID=UPI0006447D78
MECATESTGRDVQRALTTDTNNGLPPSGERKFSCDCCLTLIVRLLFALSNIQQVLILVTVIISQSRRSSHHFWRRRTSSRMHYQ